MSLWDTTHLGSRSMYFTCSSTDFLTLPFSMVSRRTFPEDSLCLLLEVTILPFPRWFILSWPYTRALITLHGNWCLHFYCPGLYMRAETGSQCLVQSTQSRLNTRHSWKAFLPALGLDWQCNISVGLNNRHVLELLRWELAVKYINKFVGIPDEKSTPLEDSVLGSQSRE